MIQRVVAEALARLGGIDGIGGQDASAVLDGVVVAGGIVLAHTTPIAAGMPREAVRHVFGRAWVECAGCGDYLPQGEQAPGNTERIVVVGVAGHDGFLSFFDCEVQQLLHLCPSGERG